jgi:CDP-glucose 4,6-dehydratase
VRNTFWQDQHVFVTGGTGLVGGWLIEELLRQEANVVALVRDWVPHSRLLNKSLLERVNIVRGDLSDPKFLERVLAEYEVKIVFHLAAQTIVPIAYASPLSTFESNIAGTWNLLEACRVYKKTDSIVVASSDKAYGEVEQLPYTEEMSLRAVYPYDVSKACADRISVCYAKTWDVPVAITRCGNFFGGGDLNWNRLVPGTIRSILRHQSPVIRSNGQFIRDYIYAEDAVSAYLTLAENLALNSTLKGEAFNFSSQNPLTALELTNQIIALMQSELEPIILNQINAEIPAQHLDSTKARDMLNWRPIYGLQEGLMKTIEWYKGYLGGSYAM